LESHLATLWTTAVSSRQRAVRHSPLSSDTSRTRRTFECAAPSKSESTRTKSKPASSIGNSALYGSCSTQALAIKRHCYKLCGDKLRQAPQASPRNRQAEPQLRLARRLRRYDFAAGMHQPRPRLHQFSLSIAPASPGSRASARAQSSYHCSGRIAAGEDGIAIPECPCSCCGFKITELPLSVREWVCGTLHDRDINAACTIRHFGILELTPGGVHVPVCGGLRKTSDMLALAGEAESGAVRAARSRWLYFPALLRRKVAMGRLTRPRFTIRL
jgi:hypothetical protein